MVTERRRVLKHDRVVRSHTCMRLKREIVHPHVWDEPDPHVDIARRRHDPRAIRRESVFPRHREPHRMLRRGRRLRRVFADDMTV